MHFLSCKGGHEFPRGARRHPTVLVLGSRAIPLDITDQILLRLDAASIGSFSLASRGALLAARSPGLWRAKMRQLAEADVADGSGQAEDPAGQVAFATASLNLSDPFTAYAHTVVLRRVAAAAACATRRCTAGRPAGVHGSSSASTGVSMRWWREFATAASLRFGAETGHGSTGGSPASGAALPPCDVPMRLAAGGRTTTAVVQTRPAAPGTSAPELALRFKVRMPPVSPGRGTVPAVLRRRAGAGDRPWIRIVIAPAGWTRIREARFAVATFALDGYDVDSDNKNDNNDKNNNDAVSGSVSVRDTQLGELRAVVLRGGADQHRRASVSDAVAIVDERTRRVLHLWVSTPVAALGRIRARFAGHMRRAQRSEPAQRVWPPLPEDMGVFASPLPFGRPAAVPAPRAIAVLRAGPRVLSSFAVRCGGVGVDGRRDPIEFVDATSFSPALDHPPHATLQHAGIAHEFRGLVTVDLCVSSRGRGGGGEETMLASFSRSIVLKSRPPECDTRGAASRRGRTGCWDDDADSSSEGSAEEGRAVKVAVWTTPENSKIKLTLVEKLVEHGGSGGGSDGRLPRGGGHPGGRGRIAPRRLQRRADPGRTHFVVQSFSISDWNV
jgi:hypothetical protein